jgi:hypothetical protein
LKECGDCSLCCKLIEVPPLEKPANQWCQHCTKRSCAIYEKRPTICHSFDCLWKVSHVLGDELQPSKCKVVFEVFHPERIVLAMVDPDRPRAWGTGEPLKLIQRMVHDGYAVWVTIGPNRHLLLPEGDTEGAAWGRSLKARERMGWQPPPTATTSPQ